MRARIWLCVAHVRSGVVEIDRHHCTDTARRALTGGSGKTKMETKVSLAVGVGWCVDVSCTDRAIVVSEYEHPVSAVLILRFSCMLAAI